MPQEGINTWITTKIRAKKHLDHFFFKREREREREGHTNPPFTLGGVSDF